LVIFLFYIGIGVYDTFFAPKGKKIFEANHFQGPYHWWPLFGWAIPGINLIYLMVIIIVLIGISTGKIP
jgi:hypothetical protein